MTELEQFEELKKKVLLKYQEYYPFFQGNWKTFSSQDIQNLIGLIEEHCKQTISEKWIYTHLKPEISSKVPRKDMLTILCLFVGYSGWDEFVFEDKVIVSQESKPSKRSKKWLLVFPLVFLFSVVIWYFNFYKNDNHTTKTIELKNEFTNENVNGNDIKVVQVEDSISRQLEVQNGKITLQSNQDKPTKLIIKSPFYRTRTLDINASSSVVEPPTTIDLKPDDYAMMLKAFMLSDIKDWQIRKEQLNKILSDELEVIVMLKDDLGAEYFNKKEFAQKLIVPSASLKKLKIVEIKNDGNKQIQFIRIKQE
jgi:hypothetical protein